jgi:hypothetical protein
MAVRKIDEPTLWKSDQNDNAKLKRELDSCEKENRSLNNLIAYRRSRHTSRQGQEVGCNAIALNLAFPVWGSVEAAVLIR